MRFWFFLPMLAAWAPAFGQGSLRCAATAVPAILRTEGLTERVGDIVLTCTGGPPGGFVDADLTIFSASGNPITNRVRPDGTTDILVSASGPTGETLLDVRATPESVNRVRLAAIRVPVAAGGTASIRISNVLVTPPTEADRAVQLLLSSNGPSTILSNASQLNVGFTQPGLLAAYSSTFICTQTPTPATVSFTNFVTAGVRFSSFRATEGFAAAFQKRDAQSDSGTRIVVKYTGFPAGARLFTPTAVVGSSGGKQTSAGDLGLLVSGGEYTAAGQLLLSRVENANASGAGGSPAIQTPSTVTTFDQLTEVPLSGGAGLAVYEVLDSSPNARESAQIPTFLVLGQRPENGSVRANISLSLGPISTAAQTVSLPVPRFLEVAPPSDCASLGDCNAEFFPKLTVALDGPPLNYDVVIGSSGLVRYVRILNDRGGVMPWGLSVNYKSSRDWLRIDTLTGLNNATVRVDAIAPAGFQPGDYEATLLIDAGPFAGSTSLPIRMTARNFGPAPIEISSVIHGAFQPGPLVPGSLATVFGTYLAGTKVEVLVNSQPARVLYAGANQINFEVPLSAASMPSMAVTVIVDGRPGPVRMVQVSLSNPGILAGGVANQDNSANSASNPALAGTTVQLYLTGLGSGAALSRPGPVTVQWHDRIISTLAYAGPAPGIGGVQQVNFVLPADLGTQTVHVQVCAGLMCGTTRLLSILRSGQ